eukprot:255248-Chlamydomonas_euryale.AAC.3
MQGLAARSTAYAPDCVTPEPKFPTDPPTVSLGTADRAGRGVQMCHSKAQIRDRPSHCELGNRRPRKTWCSDVSSCLQAN